MAVTLAFRIAIALAPVGVRMVRYVQSPRLATLDRRLHGDLGLWPFFTDEELTARVAAATGTVSEVVFTEVAPFELRKCQVMWSRNSGPSGEEDMAVCTFHFLKLDAGEPTDSWDPADYEVFEGAFDTFWGSIKGKYFPHVSLRQYRWYATGPEVDTALGGPGRTGPPRRVTDRTLPGTSGLTPAVALPPQVAISITEKCSDPKSWGRFYLPALQAEISSIDQYGRIPPTWQATLANNVETLYDACSAANIPIVVYSAAKPERLTKGGATLEAAPARALSVDQIQVDDLYDVIRSRRWTNTALRVVEDIGS